MDAKTLYREYRAYCEANNDPELVRKYARYFREGYDAWGLSQQLMDDFVKDVCSRSDFSLKIIQDAAPLFMKSGKYEETSFILSVLNRCHHLFDRRAFDAISGWFDIGIRNWAHADMLGMMILPVFLKKKIINRDDFQNWLDAPYKFQRRCVPVTLIKSLKTEKSFLPLFEFLEKLMNDPEREVHQGMGWFLREAWKIRPEETESFLLRWKNDAPRLIFQYACEKMTAEGKAVFKKEKSVKRSAGK